MELDKKRVDEIISMALKEDVGPIDVTVNAVIPKNAIIKADILAQGDGIICGLPICEAVFEKLNADIRFKPQVSEGDRVFNDKALCYLEGPARGILTGERTALNFLGILSGIATATERFVGICAPYGVKVMDTRKTAPGLRYLERYAVRTGGGHNHRMGLWDQVLIKDNHLKVMSKCRLALGAALKEARQKVQKDTRIEVEVAGLNDFIEALKGGPDIIMLDNMAPHEVKKAIAIAGKTTKRPLIEVSGGITLENIGEYAAHRPDIISIGSITHSFVSLDLSLEVYG